MDIRSLPVILGIHDAARLACVVMAVPQAVVIVLLWRWALPWHATGVAALLIVQLILMRRLLSDPLKQARWYNATGTSAYVLGMLGAAFGVATVIGA